MIKMRIKNHNSISHGFTTDRRVAISTAKNNAITAE